MVFGLFFKQGPFKEKENVALCWFLKQYTCIYTGLIVILTICESIVSYKNTQIPSVVASYASLAIR